MSKTINLAVIAGDGIGPEVVAEGLKVLDVDRVSHGLRTHLVAHAGSLRSTSIS